MEANAYKKKNILMNGVRRGNITKERADFSSIHTLLLNTYIQDTIPMLQMKYNG